MKHQTVLFSETEIKAGADFSHNRKHRFSLWRIWDESMPLALFIGLNPSTANEAEADPTIRSVTRIARHNGYGGFYMMNCWSFVSSDPDLLETNPMADEQNSILLSLIAGKCKDVVFAWGNFKIVRQQGRDAELVELFPNALCLKQNKNGSPMHPLFCKGSTPLIPYIIGTTTH